MEIERGDIDRRCAIDRDRIRRRGDLCQHNVRRSIPRYVKGRDVVADTLMNLQLVKPILEVSDDILPKADRRINEVVFRRASAQGVVASTAID